MELKEAIEHIDELLSKDNLDCEECKNEHRQLRSWLAELQIRRRNNNWIPVDKNNLPDHEVLACDIYGNELIGYLDVIGEGFFCEDGDAGICMYDVIAWMEKPEPYKTERNNNV